MTTLHTDTHFIIKGIQKMASYILSGGLHITALCHAVCREPQSEFKVRIYYNLLKLLPPRSLNYLAKIHLPVLGQEILPGKLFSKVNTDKNIELFVSAQKIIDCYSHIITAEGLASLIEKSNLMKCNSGSIQIYVESTLKDDDVFPRRTFRVAISAYPHLIYKRFFQKARAFNALYFIKKGAETILSASGYTELPAPQEQTHGTWLEKQDVINLLKELEVQAAKKGDTRLRKGCIVLRLSIEDKDRDIICSESQITENHISEYRNYARKTLLKQGIFLMMTYCRKDIAYEKN